LQQTVQFTLGFVEQRIMLNKILTTDGGLSQLENEFLKRGIAAVTFEAGITLARYKRAIAVLVTPAKLIDRQGGARPFLEQNPLENVHEKVWLPPAGDRKSTRLNSSHGSISYAVFCLKKKKKKTIHQNNANTNQTLT